MTLIFTLKFIEHYKIRVSTAQSRGGLARSPKSEPLFVSNWVGQNSFLEKWVEVGKGMFNIAPNSLRGRLVGVLAKIIVY